MRLEYDNQECQEGEKTQFYSRMPLEEWEAALRVIRAALKVVHWYNTSDDWSRKVERTCEDELEDALEALPEYLRGEV